MAVSTSELSLKIESLSSGHRLRAFSRSLFGLLQLAPQPDLHHEIHRQGIHDLNAADVSTALSLRRDYFNLPTDLRLVPDRITTTDRVQAAGYINDQSPSVSIDLARWSHPCPSELNEIAWRRVFTWIVGADPQIANASILQVPTMGGNCLTGSYGYDLDGEPGYGVLVVARAAGEVWLICDCWGDASTANHIDAIASSIMPNRS